MKVKKEELKNLNEINNIQEEILGFFEDVFVFWVKNVKTDSFWHKELFETMTSSINKYKKEAENFNKMVALRKTGEWPEENLEVEHHVRCLVFNDILQGCKYADFKVSENQHFEKMLTTYENHYRSMKWEREHGVFDVPASKNSYYSHTYNCSYGFTEEYEVLDKLIYKCLEAPYEVRFCPATPAQKRMGVFPDEHFPEYED